MTDNEYKQLAKLLSRKKRRRRKKKTNRRWIVKHRGPTKRQKKLLSLNRRSIRFSTRKKKNECWIQHKVNKKELERPAFKEIALHIHRSYRKLEVFFLAVFTYKTTLRADMRCRCAPSTRQRPEVRVRTVRVRTSTSTNITKPKPPIDSVDRFTTATSLQGRCPSRPTPTPPQQTKKYISKATDLANDNKNIFPRPQRRRLWTKTMTVISGEGRVVL